MSYANIWVHAVWATKHREKRLRPEILPSLCRHIKDNAIKKGFYVDLVNGHVDHLHCLMKLKGDNSIAKQMQLIKGESCNWINRQGIFLRKFEWADEYFAASVSESRLGWVRNYIIRQEEHHREIPFEEEYAKFLEMFSAGQG